MTRKLLFSLAIVAIAAPLQLSASTGITTAKTGISASTVKTGKDFRPKKKKKGKKGKHGQCEAFQR